MVTQSVHAIQLLEARAQVHSISFYASKNESGASQVLQWTNVPASLFTRVTPQAKT